MSNEIVGRISSNTIITANVIYGHTHSNKKILDQMLSGSSGDMLVSIYDPNFVNGDAFSVDNHANGTINKVYTLIEQSKLSSIAEGAEINVQSDWDAATGDAVILNKPTISSGGGGVASTRFVIGTSTSGWTADDCDYFCDGISDEVEINAAITALPADGGEVLILDGTYAITNAIKITSRNNVSIRGNGNATILKRMYNTILIELTTATYCIIKDLQIDGNRATYTDSSNSGIFLYLSDNNTVTGNTSNNNSYDGIYLKDSNNNTVTGNTSNNNGKGIELSQSDNSTVTGNTSNNNGNYGIHLEFADNNTITGNASNNNGVYGIRLYLSENSTITANISDNNAYYGIYLKYIENSTVTGNTSNNNARTGIYLDSFNNSTITANISNNNSNYGIDLSQSENSTITANISNNNAREGIYLDRFNNSTITGNTSNNNGDAGILLDDCNRNTVTANNCIRGTGLSTDYSATQYTIMVEGTANNYNLISSNQCMGKAVVIEGGTSNTEVNNKFV